MENNRLRIKIRSRLVKTSAKIALRNGFKIRPVKQCNKGLIK